MFVLTGGLQQQAVEQYRERYRSMEKDVHPVTLGEYHTDCDFRSREGEQRKIQAFYEARRDEALATVKNLPAFIGFGVGAAAAVGAFFVGYFLFAITAIALIYGGFTLFSNSKRRAQLAADCQNSIAGKEELMTRLFAEYGKLQEEYRAYDGYSEQIEAAFQLF